MPATAAPATYAYLALTDPTIKKWHLGAETLGSVAFCGTRLLEPQDTHPAAKRVPVADRHHETSPDVALVDCGLCKRNREYAFATGTPRPDGLALTVPKARYASGVDAATLTGTATRTRPSAAGTHASTAAISGALTEGEAAEARPAPRPGRRRRPPRRPPRRRGADPGPASAWPPRPPPPPTRARRPRASPRRGPRSPAARARPPRPPPRLRPTAPAAPSWPRTRTPPWTP